MRRKPGLLHLTGRLGRQDVWPDLYWRMVQFEQMRDVKHLARLQRTHYNNECFSEPAQSGKRRLRIRDGFGDLAEFSTLGCKNAAWTHLKFYDDSHLLANVPSYVIPDRLIRTLQILGSRSWSFYFHCFGYS